MSEDDLIFRYLLPFLRLVLVTMKILLRLFAVVLCSMADGATNSLAAGAVSNSLALTLLKPDPVPFDYFGNAVAAMGSDRVLIGAPRENDFGVVYLFSIDGTLLCTLTNPAPTRVDYFGISVAAAGNDRVLIGATANDVGGMVIGAAYLFSTNGTLLTVFTNPIPAIGDGFGFSVATLGDDRMLVGASADDTGANDAGAAFLFSANGALLTTFTNPTPGTYDYFGFSVAALGNDRVLVGAFNDDTTATNAGAAYLFSTNGTLLTTFNNPMPADGDFFGYSVAALGNDRVLIGAYQDSVGAHGDGAAYLFSTNGTLLTTFTNPTPSIFERFGSSVTAMGNRVLVGAHQAGAAYLFSTNGMLLTTFSKPVPDVADAFGYSVAAVGNNRVLIGAYSDSTGATEAGAAYLFTVETSSPSAPHLSVEMLADGNVRVFWPRTAEGFVLDETSTLTSPPATISWMPVPIASYQTNATHLSITITPSQSKFYRLKKL